MRFFVVVVVVVAFMPVLPGKTNNLQVFEQKS